MECVGNGAIQVIFEPNKMVCEFCSFLQEAHFRTRCFKLRKRSNVRHNSPTILQGSILGHLLQVIYIYIYICIYNIYLIIATKFQLLLPHF